MCRTLTLIILTLFISPAWALEAPSIETGKRLFESRQLGSTGKGCSSCHPGGQKLEGSSQLDNNQLIAAMNLCIERSVQGTPLEPSSTEMNSLSRYVRSLPLRNSDK